MKEADFHAKKLPVDIGVKWKDLARELEFSQASIEIIAKENFHNAKECCIAVLVRWLRREGKDATAEKLVEALVEIGLKNVADRFPSKPSDTSQVILTDIHIYIIHSIYIIYIYIKTRNLEVVSVRNNIISSRRLPSSH